VNLDRNKHNINFLKSVAFINITRYRLQCCMFRKNDIDLRLRGVSGTTPFQPS